MDVALPADLRKQVEQELASGRYRSRDELIEQAIRHFLEHRQRGQRRLDALRRIGQEVDHAGLYERGMVTRFDVAEFSSRWVHEQFPARKRFGWQAGYGAFTVSGSRSDDVRNYIASQEAHHRRISFQEEFLTLLKKHGLEYDARDVWG